VRFRRRTVRYGSTNWVTGLRCAPWLSVCGTHRVCVCVRVRACACGSLSLSLSLLPSISLTILHALHSSHRNTCSHLLTANIQRRLLDNRLLCRYRCTCRRRVVHQRTLGSSKIKTTWCTRWKRSSNWSVFFSLPHSFRSRVALQYYTSRGSAALRFGPIMTSHRRRCKQESKKMMC
jgi:hypothetical protein